MALSAAAFATRSHASCSAWPVCSAEGIQASVPCHAEAFCLAASQALVIQVSTSAWESAPPEAVKPSAVPGSRKSPAKARRHIRAVPRALATTPSQIAGRVYSGYRPLNARVGQRGKMIKKQVFHRQPGKKDTNIPGFRSCFRVAGRNFFQSLGVFRSGTERFPSMQAAGGGGSSDGEGCHF